MQRVQRIARLPWESIAMMAMPAMVGLLLVQVRAMDVLSPFAAAFCATLFMMGKAGLFAALGCVVGLLFSGGGALPLTAWVVSGLTICHMVVALSGYRIRRKLHTVLFVLLIVCSVVASTHSPYLLILSMINGVLAMILHYIYFVAVGGLAAVWDKQPLSVAQTLSLGALVLSVVMGTGGMTILTLNLMHILLGAMAMILALCVPAAICGCFGIVAGFIAALCGGASIGIVSDLGLCALISGYCGRLGKFGSIMGFMLANALFTLYFVPTGLSLHLGEAMIAALICLLVPQHVIDALSALVCHHVTRTETARATMISLYAVSRIKSLAEALEKGARVILGRPAADRAVQAAAGRQLDMAARELHKTAHAVHTSEPFDTMAERAIVHRMRLLGLEPRDVAVQKNRDGVSVRVEQAGCGGRRLCEGVIKKTVGDACRMPMTLQSRPCALKNKRSCTLRYHSKQPVLVRGGVATAKRKDERVCGDVVSTCKLDGGRELFCLCDGMGSGQNARDAAEMAVDLIESFFQAGFEQDRVLRTVNELLTLRQSEVFAAADILLIDTVHMLARFIKTCAGPSLLIRDGRVTVIEMEALPIGVLDGVQPAIMEKRIRIGDCIVMITDGIADAMRGEDIGQWLEYALKQSDESRAANELLELAQKKMGQSYDDMTAVVLRVVRAARA